MYEQLSGLCRDAAWTKTYILAALIAAKEMFQVQMQAKQTPGPAACMQTLSLNSSKPYPAVLMAQGAPQNAAADMQD